MKKYILCLLLFTSCKTYYYFDQSGCEHRTHDRTKEKEIVSYKDTLWGGFDYYYVLRGNKNQVRLAMGNLFDTTNWTQKKEQLLKPAKIKNGCRCQ